MPNKHPSNHSNSQSKYIRNLALMMCLGMLAGILIWAKLRLVTDIPRSAYADPRETQLDPKPNQPQIVTSDDQTTDLDQEHMQDHPNAANHSKNDPDE